MNTTSPAVQGAPASTAGTARITENDIDKRLVAAYWPLHRSVLITIGCYYIYVTAGHFLDESGLTLAALATLSAASALFCFLLLSLRIRQRIIRPFAVEVSMGAISLVLLANTAAYQFTHYDATKLVYYPLVAIVSALCATTNRSTLFGVAIALAAMVATLLVFDPSGVSRQFTVGVTTAVTAIGLSTFVRGVISREVQARLNADLAASRAVAASVETSRLARLDPLTAVPNRRGFFDMIERAIADGGGAPSFAVGVVDLDGFKAVNDVYGHSVGDRVLREVAARLSHVQELSVRSARLGGDEFGLLILGEPTDEQLHTLARELSLRLAEPFRLGTAFVRLSGSFGYTRARRNDTVEAVLDRADYAAYEAKHRRRGNAVIFSASHEARIGAERLLERAVIAADFDHEIRPVFQPIVDGISGEVVGYEALARWHHPEIGELSPAQFIPMAERLGVAPRITRAMTRRVLEFAARLPAGQRISINLSAHDLASADAMAELSQLLSSFPQQPCRVDFEITETAVMSDVTEATAALLLLAAHGAQIALDDFGTGHSSLSRVQHLPLDRIKVDRSFVASVTTDRASAAIVRTTLDLCRNLGVTCVLEGVETTAERDALLAMGARYFQGYLYGRPAPAEIILADLETRRRIA